MIFSEQRFGRQGFTGRVESVPVITTNCEANHAGSLFTQQICSQALSAVRPVTVNAWPTWAELTAGWS